MSRKAEVSSRTARIIKAATEVDEFCQKKFHGIIRDHALSDLFSREEMEDFRCQMMGEVERYKGNEEVTKQYFENLQAKLQQIAARAEELKNVKRQQYEIMQYELKPGHVDVREFVGQEARMIPFEGGGCRGWISRRDGFGDAVPAFPSSIVGGSVEAVDWVRRNYAPIIHSATPSKLYRNLVFDQAGMCFQDLRLAKAEFEAGLRGEELSEKERASLTKIGRGSQIASNLLEVTASGAMDVFNFALRGVASKSKVSEDKRLHEYLRLRNEILSQSVWRVGDTPQTSYLNSLHALAQRLHTSGDLLDQAQFVEMQKLIQDEIGKVTEMDEAALKKFNEQIQSLNAEMVDTVKSNLVKEDDMWKFRVAQIALLMLFPVGNIIFMTPALQLISPLFNPAMNFGQGLAAIGTSPVFGPFGQLFDWLQLDVATEWLTNNLPIVKEFGQVFDTVTNTEFMQNLGGVVGPALTGSALPMIGLTGVYSLFRFDREVKHYQEQRETQKDVGDKFNVGKQRQKLKAACEDFEKTILSDSIKARIAEFSKKELDAMVGANMTVEAVKFILDCRDGELGIFKDIGLTTDGKEMSLKDFVTSKGAVALSTHEMLKVLNENKAARDQIVQRHCAYQEFRKDDVDDGIAQFDLAKAAGKLEEIQKKQAMESRQQFMEDYADLHGFYSACTDPRLPRTDSDEPFTDEKKATLRELRRVDFEKQFIELKIRSRVAAQGIPSPKIPLPECSPVSAKQIGGQTPQVAAAA